MHIAGLVGVGGRVDLDLLDRWIGTGVLVEDEAVASIPVEGPHDAERDGNAGEDRDEVANRHRALKTRT